MVYIYEKDLNTGNVKLYQKVMNENSAKAKVADLNEESLFYDKYYFISEKMQRFSRSFNNIEFR